MFIDWTYFYIVASGHFCTLVLVPCCTFVLEHLRYDNREDEIISIYIYILDINVTINSLLHSCFGTFLQLCMGTFVHFSLGTSMKT